jgi:hypothetical protein
MHLQHKSIHSCGCIFLICYQKGLTCKSYGKVFHRGNNSEVLPYAFYLTPLLFFQQVLQGYDLEHKNEKHPFSNIRNYLLDFLGLQIQIILHNAISFRHRGDFEFPPISPKDVGTPFTNRTIIFNDLCWFHYFIPT